jgi:hypothetical protein
MSWHDLLFMHWPLPADLLRPLVPAGLQIDTFEGQAWLGIVPFRMTGVTPRCVPSLPWISAFPELNVRTYVRTDDKPGVWFFSLDAANPLAVFVARRQFYLPYFNARMSLTETAGEIHYQSIRTHSASAPAAFRGRYRPTGEIRLAEPGTLEHWLTERYCLYSSDGQGNLWRGEIHHQPWPLQPAEAHIEINTMAQPSGIPLPEIKPLLHFARRLDVVAWSLEAVALHSPASTVAALL